MKNITYNGDPRVQTLGECIEMDKKRDDLMNEIHRCKEAYEEAIVSYQVFLLENYKIKD